MADNTELSPFEQDVIRLRDLSKKIYNLTDKPEIGLMSWLTFLCADCEEMAKFLEEKGFCTCSKSVETPKPTTIWVVEAGDIYEGPIASEYFYSRVDALEKFIDLQIRLCPGVFVSECDIKMYVESKETCRYVDLCEVKMKQ